MEMAMVEAGVQLSSASVTLLRREDTALKGAGMTMAEVMDGAAGPVVL